MKTHLVGDMILVMNGGNLMSESVNKKALAEKVAERLDITKKSANEIVDVVFEEITKVLVEGGKVDVSGFGRFSVKERESRQGYNPQTKETITVPSSKAPAFRPSKALKEVVK